MNSITKNRQAIKQANKWRTDYNRHGHGGVVVVFNGVVNGWVNKLRNPEQWQPGCIAVDEQQDTWIACGGNAQSGAERWEAVQ
ncbi:hypothetical protein [Candidatus Venteria ishoeyi]|uniref:Antirestriction protein ArdR n=1 Tax=Candidatus Venteria ishoeyi TaxID=1899563 RepID=A0A1H6F9C5_9GAMM|nr:hypothetical protein [Candidatus Venteria ishoeyi]MDM8545178.1 hypothetical protein [Candidatus Venteria ishoeyi]SEH06698.1 Uncharacterised protein [Candidatus Venteria ishoeyi]